jgi:hypothetical protein
MSGRGWGDAKAELWIVIRQTGLVSDGLLLEVIESDYIVVKVESEISISMPLWLSDLASDEACGWTLMFGEKNQFTKPLKCRENKSKRTWMANCSNQACKRSKAVVNLVLQTQHLHIHISVWMNIPQSKAKPGTLDSRLE